MQKESNKMMFSFSVENIHLDKSFPLDFFDYQVFKDPLDHLHSHDGIEIGLCQSGTGLFIIGNEVYAYKPGDMVFIGPEVYHRAHSNSNEKDLWTFFYLKAEDWECKSFTQPLQIMTGRSDEPMLFYFLTELHTEMKEKKNEYKNISKGLVIAILSYLHRINKNAGDILSPNSQPWQQFDERINKSLSYMLDEKSDNISMSDLALKCGLSDSRFRKLFLSQTGVSPKTFQRKIRLSRALGLLQAGNLRIIDIAYECGFSSLCNFNRAFKEVYRVSPSIWRRTHVGK